MKCDSERSSNSVYGVWYGTLDWWVCVVMVENGPFRFNFVWELKNLWTVCVCCGGCCLFLCLWMPGLDLGLSEFETGNLQFWVWYVCINNILMPKMPMWISRRCVGNTFFFLVYPMKNKRYKKCFDCKCVTLLLSLKARGTKKNKKWNKIFFILYIIHIYKVKDKI